MKKTLICFLGVLCAIAILAAKGIHAQTVGTGAIQGTVEDSSGAVVQGATVTATNPKTGLSSLQSSSSTGNYRIDALPPSVYTVTASAPGFTSIQQINVEVDAMTVMTLNLQLKVGAANATVTVSALPPQLDTSDGTLEVTLSNDAYTNLPLEMAGSPKSPLGFLALVPGTQSADFGENINGGPGQSSSMYINGMPITSSTVQGDTRDIQTQTSTEIVDQFQVLSSGIPAYYSGNGIANLIMKSGTNKFHGDVYENIRNTVFDAAGYFAAPGTTPVERQNEYGATLGGPVIKNKLFFLFNYDGYRFTQGTNPSYYALPTAAERTGDFSALLAQGEVIYDPATTSCNSSGICTRQAFSNNMIPSGRISHASTYLQSFLPPTLSNNAQNNYLGSLTGGDGQNMYSGNFDYQLTSKNHIRYLTQHGSNPPIGLPPNGGAQLPLPYISDRASFSSVTVEQLTDAATLSPNLVNTFGFQFNRFYSPFVNPTTSGKYTENAGLQNLPSGDPQVEFPPVNFSGLNSPTYWDSYTYTYGWNEITNTFTTLDNVQWNKGPHSFTFGGQIQRFQDNVLFPSAIFGYSFANNETAGFGSDGTINENTGNSYASYLLGEVDNASLTDSIVGTTGMRYTTYSLYAQDDWKISRKLIINAGLRYDLPKPGVEVHNYQSWLNATLPNPAVGNYPGILQFAGNGTDSCHCGTPVSTDYVQFSPRIGFAYSLASKYVVRGSYGINRYKAGLLSGGAYFQGSGYTGYEASPGFGSPNGGITPAFEWDSPFPSYTPPPFLNATLNTGYNTTTGPFAGSLTYSEPSTAGRMPYTQDWNLTFEDQITPSLVTSASYAGSRSIHVTTPGGSGIYSDQINPKYLALGNLLLATETPTTLAEAQAVFSGIQLPYPNFSGSIGQMLLPFPQYSGVADPFALDSSSTYNALQVTARKTMSHGLYVLLAYSWSKEMSDDGMNIIPWASGNNRSAYDIKQEEAPDSNNQPQVLAVSYIYQLPIGRGQAVGGNMSQALDSVLGNWQIAGIDSYNSGTPIGPIGGACSTYYTDGCYASYNPTFSGPVRINGKWGSGDPKGGTSYINAAAFMDAAQFTFGNTPREAPFDLHNPWYLNENLSLSKIFSLEKGMSLKMQADAFNLFNRTQFSGIATYIDSSNFGQVGGQGNQPRQLQFEAYLRF